MLPRSLLLLFSWSLPSEPKLGTTTILLTIGLIFWKYFSRTNHQGRHSLCPIPRVTLQSPDWEGKQPCWQLTSFFENLRNTPKNIIELITRAVRCCLNLFPFSWSPSSEHKTGTTTILLTIITILEDTFLELITGILTVFVHFLKSHSEPWLGRIAALLAANLILEISRNTPKKYNRTHYQISQMLPWSLFFLFSWSLPSEPRLGTTAVLLTIGLIFWGYFLELITRVVTIFVQFPESQFRTLIGKESSPAGS